MIQLSKMVKELDKQDPRYYQEFTTKCFIDASSIEFMEENSDKTTTIYLRSGNNYKVKESIGRIKVLIEGAKK